MNNLVNYILESGISLAFLSTIYLLFLRKETFFKLNRIFLIGSVTFSVLLPFLRLRIFDPKPVVLEEITITPYRNLIEAVTVYGNDLSGSIEQAILSANTLILLYVGGLLVFLARFLFRIIQLWFVIRKNNVQNFASFKLVTVNKNVSPFSFLNFIFLSRQIEKNDDYDKMIAHEMEHVKQGHSFDVIILEILTIFHWFNPFIWMLRRSIRENHEFLADQAVLNSGVNKGYYKSLLLKQYVGEQFVISNNFNYSMIKKRIKMMSQIKSSKFANSKILPGIVVAAALLLVFACEQKESFETGNVFNQGIINLSFVGEKIKINGDQNEVFKLQDLMGKSGFSFDVDENGDLYMYKNKISEIRKLDSNEQVFYIVEDMPEYPGGEEAMRKFISQSIVYPKEAVQKGIQGRVYVSFVVAADGTVANAKIARGVDKSIDEEALRVINSLPMWKPGKQKGQAVHVKYTVPIHFELQETTIKPQNNLQPNS